MANPPALWRCGTIFAATSSELLAKMRLEFPQLNSYNGRIVRVELQAAICFIAVPEAHRLPEYDPFSADRICMRIPGRRPGR
jgi:hypothetical protein